MSDVPRLTLLKFPKPVPPPEPRLELSPQAAVIDQAYQMHEQIKNIAILVHLEDGDVQILPALDPNVDLLAFIEVVKMRFLQSTNDYLSIDAPGKPVTA